MLVLPFHLHGQQGNLSHKSALKRHRSVSILGAPEERSYEESCWRPMLDDCCCCWGCWGLSMVSEGKSAAREKLSKPPGLMLRWSGSGSCCGVGME